jgi:hypothetical protein
MKKAVLFAAALTIMAGLPLWAQQAGATAQQSAAATAGGDRVSESGKAAAAADDGAGRVSGTAAATQESSADLRSVNGQLEGKLDARTAKAGDRVVLKTTENVKTADGTVIPKGTKLVGHVTEAEAHGSASQDSHVGIEFDRAELRNGQSLAIHSAIQSVAPPASMAAGAAGDDDLFANDGASRMTAGSRAGAGARLGAGEVVSGTASTAGHAVERTSSAAQSDVRSTAQSAGRETAAAGGKINGRLSGSTSTAMTAHATGVKGVMLTGSASSSGTLSASKKNVHLDSGTQMTLGVAAAK